jgi:RND family efflux transporter MFP subunit
MKNFNFKSRSGLIIAGVVVVLLAGGIALSVMRSKTAQDRPAAAPRPALTVTSAQPTQASLPIKLSANGNIAAWQEAIIGSEANGLRLAEIRAAVGDSVSAGQILAVFAPEAVQADLAAARAAVAEAEANAADASANAARARSLQSSGALSAQQINQYFTGEQTAKARVESAHAHLAAQQLRLKHTELRAPDNGVISARTATVGAVVGAGTELFRMIRQGRLEWRAEVTSTELASLKRGSTAVITVANGNQLKGVVRMIAPTVDVQTRSALVYVDLPADDKMMTARAGMFARGEFELGTSTALTVAQQAIVVRDGFSYVFRLNADSRVTQLKVTTGRRLGDRVEVLDALEPTAKVVVSGAGFLNDGDFVRNVAAAPVVVPVTLPASAAPAAKK